MCCIDVIILLVHSLIHRTAIEHYHVHKSRNSFDKHKPKITVVFSGISSTDILIQHIVIECYVEEHMHSSLHKTLQSYLSGRILD